MSSFAARVAAVAKATADSDDEDNDASDVRPYIPPRELKRLWLKGKHLANSTSLLGSLLGCWLMVIVRRLRWFAYSVFTLSPAHSYCKGTK